MLIEKQRIGVLRNQATLTGPHSVSKVVDLSLLLLVKDKRVIGVDKNGLYSEL